MRLIGILGGMSWASTVEYYRILNEEVARRLGGLASARARGARRRLHARLIRRQQRQE